MISFESYLARKNVNVSSVAARYLAGTGRGSWRRKTIEISKATAILPRPLNDCLWQCWPLIYRNKNPLKMALEAGTKSGAIFDRKYGLRAIIKDWVFDRLDCNRVTDIETLRAAMFEAIRRALNDGLSEVLSIQIAFKNCRPARESSPIHNDPAAHLRQIATDLVTGWQDVLLRIADRAEESDILRLCVEIDSYLRKGSPDLNSLDSFIRYLDDKHTMCESNKAISR